ncbi:uncharacterized protein LOC143279913 isoform X2 [Babylonia areolata]
MKAENQKRVLAVGRLLVHATFLTFAIAFFSQHWVCRVYDSEEETGTGAELLMQLRRTDKSVVSPRQLYCFGIWIACDVSDRCGDVWRLVPGPGEMMVRLVQMQATVTLLGYLCASMLDAASSLSFCVCLAYNRTVECVLASSAVLHFLAVLYQTGQVKNKALRVHLLRDSLGWGFALSATSLALAVTATTVLALFRLPPPAYWHRSFWRMPLELRPRTYLASLTTTTTTSVTGSAAAGRGGVGCVGVGGGVGLGDGRRKGLVRSMMEKLPKALQWGHSVFREKSSKPR